MTIPVITFLFLSIAALIATWRKERIVDGQSSGNRFAIRIAFGLQLAAATMGTYNFYSADVESKRQRTAQLAFEASSAGASHLPEIMSTYFRCLRPGHYDLQNWAKFEQALLGVPPELRQSLESGETVQAARARQQAVLVCYSRFQDQALEVLSEATKFGDQYPQELLRWAQATSELSTAQLVEITGDGVSAQKYVALMSKGVFHALATAYLQNQERSK